MLNNIQFTSVYIPDKEGKMKTEAQRQRAIKKVQVAIDKMVDLQDMGLGCEIVSCVLDQLWKLQCNFVGQELRRQ